MERDKQRQIASKGGRAAHQKGTAHEFTSDEARRAGSKGGKASQARRQQMAFAKRQGIAPSVGAGTIAGGNPNATAQLSHDGEIFTLLRTDHATVAKIFQSMTGQAANDFAVHEEKYPVLRRELEVHASAEEEVVYPRLQQKAPELVEEAELEHKEVKELLSQLDSLYGTAVGAEGKRESWTTTMQELKENVEHHVQEEETDIFNAMARVFTQEELAQISQDFKRAKQQNLEKRQAA